MSDGPSELRQMRPFDIDAALDHIFADNPDVVKRMQSNPNAVNVVVGLGMKIAGAAVDPSVLRQKILDRLQKGNTMKLNELLTMEGFTPDQGMFSSNLNWRKQLGKRNQFSIVIEGGAYNMPPTDDAWVVVLYVEGRASLFRGAYVNYTDIEKVYRHAVGLVELIDQYETKLPFNPAARAEKERFTFEASLITSMLHDFAVVIENGHTNENPSVRSFKHGLDRVLHTSNLVSVGDPYLGEDLVLFCKNKQVADELLTYAQKFDLTAYIVDGRPKT